MSSDASPGGPPAPVRVRVTAPLIGLTSFPSECLALSNDTAIARFWGKDIGVVREVFSFGQPHVGPYDAEATSGWRFVLSRDLELSDGDELPASERLTEGFDDVVSSLRLVTSGMVRWHVYWTLPVERDEPAPYAQLSHRWFFTMARGHMEVDRDSAADLPSLVKALSRRRGLMADHLCDRLDVALRRFNMMRERREDDDRIVDGWVALEALLGTRDVDENLTEVLPRRISALVDDHAEIPSTEDLADLYRLRCKVVHGSAGIDTLSLHVSARTLESVVVASIQAWLDGDRRPRSVRDLDIK